MPNINITLPERVLFRNVGGNPVYIDWASFPADNNQFWVDLLTGGALIISGNTWNGTGKDGTETERMAAVQKRWDSWAKGQYLITDRAASQSTLMKECYVGEMLAKHDTTEKAVEAQMKATVKEVLGKDTNATFDNFLAAMATTLAKREGEKRSMDDIKALLIAKYEKAAAELEASRAKAGSAAIDLTDIDF